MTKNPTAPEVRLYRLIVAAIVFGGLILRLIHVLMIKYSPFWDMAAYWAVSDIMWSKTPTIDELHLTVASQPFYYWFFGLTRKLFGAFTYHPALVIQAFVDAVTIGFFAYVGRVLYGARVGILAALLYACYRIPVLNTGLLMTETFSTFFTMATISLFFWYCHRPSLLRASLVGVLMGLTVYVRINLASVLGVFCLYALLTGWKQHRVKPCLLQLTAMVVLTFAVMAPWTIRNSRIFHRFVPFIENQAGNALVGNNPVAYGAATPLSALPREWQEEWKNKPQAEVNKIQARQFRDFVSKTHSDFFVFTLLPVKVSKLLTDDKYMPWSMVGDGTPFELPLGPRLRFPFIDYWLIAALGFFGLLLAGRRYRWFAACLWLALFLPVVLVVAVGRYRYPSEMALVLGAAATLDRLYFHCNFRRRLMWLFVAICLYSLLATTLAWARFSGKNILDDPALLEKNPVMKQMVKSKFTTTANDRSTTPRRVIIGAFPVSPGKSSHLAFSFSFKLTRPDAYRNIDSAWSQVWPQLQSYCEYFDSDGKPVKWNEFTSYSFQYAALSHFQEAGSSQWRIIAIPGQAAIMRIGFEITNPGTVDIWGLEARGPVWRK